MSDIREKALDAVRQIYDPEIPVNIYELGLIYTLDVDEQNVVHVEMTLTSPACPVAEALPMQVQEAIARIDGVSDVDLRLVWDPPWSKERMSEEARLTLNMF